MRGKISEDTLTLVMHRAQVLAGTTPTLGELIDTQGYDEAQIVLSVGNVDARCTLGAELYVSSQAKMHTMIRVTNGIFPLSTATANKQTVLVGNIKMKNYPRYLALQVSAGGTASPTIPFSAVAILNRADDVPTSQTSSFDLGD